MSQVKFKKKKKKIPQAETHTHTNTSASEMAIGTSEYGYEEVRRRDRIDEGQPEVGGVGREEGGKKKKRKEGSGEREGRAVGGESRK